MKSRRRKEESRHFKTKSRSIKEREEEEAAQAAYVARRQIEEEKHRMTRLRSIREREEEERAEAQASDPWLRTVRWSAEDGMWVEAEGTSQTVDATSSSGSERLLGPFALANASRSSPGYIEEHSNEWYRRNETAPTSSNDISLHNKPAIQEASERMVCALCPRAPTVGACWTCGRRCCIGCLEVDASDQCWACLGYGSPQDRTGKSAGAAPNRHMGRP